MSLFRFVKYSSILFFLGKYKTRLFRVLAVLLFAVITSLLYQDVVDYLHRAHPGSVIYALMGKIIIVYGALAFVLWQFRPQAEAPTAPTVDNGTAVAENTAASRPEDRLSEFENLERNATLHSKYDRILEGRKPES